MAGTGTVPIYGYTGREPDATGLVYYRARHYDPALGRFASRDPLGLVGGINRYAYVGGNPVNRIDPTGFFAQSPQSIQVASLDAGYFTSSQGQTFGGGPTAFDFGSNVYGVSVYSAPSQPSQTIGNPFELPNSQGTQVAQNIECPLGNMSGACGGGGGNGGCGGGSGGIRVGNTAGSIRNVNPGYPTAGRTQNCVNCAVATDATLSGNPTVALPSNGPVSIKVLEQQYGNRFGGSTTTSGIEQKMLNAGDGARGIVFGSRGPNEAGHVFNVVNQNGVVRFLDGQTGKPAIFDGYKSLHLLQTK